MNERAYVCESLFYLRFALVVQYVTRNVRKCAEMLKTFDDSVNVTFSLELFATLTSTLKMNRHSSSSIS